MTDEIIEIVQRIDKKYYKENYSISWYKERYNKNNFVYCLYDKNKIVGYICACGIKKTLYNDLKKGIYNNDYDIDPNLFDNESNYMYLSSINILKEYRHKGYGEYLLKELLNNINNNLIAITASKEGYNLARKYMTEIKNLNKNVSVFERMKIKI